MQVEPRIPPEGICYPGGMPPTRTYVVTGMTCAHCERAVTEEIAAIPGVTAVDVDLATGRAEVTGDGVDDDAVRAAVGEAGYALTP